MIRDNMKLYKNFSTFFNNCHLCSKPNHFFTTCPLLHHFPDKDFLISKLNYSQPQIRTENKCIRKLKRTNAFKFLSKIRQQALEFQTNNDEDAEYGSFEPEEQEGLLITPRSIEKVDDTTPNRIYNDPNDDKEEIYSEAHSFSEAIVNIYRFSINK